jgi:hypothetical protein
VKTLSEKNNQLRIYVPMSRNGLERLHKLQAELIAAFQAIDAELSHIKNGIKSSVDKTRILYRCNYALSKGEQLMQIIPSNSEAGHNLVKGCNQINAVIRTVTRDVVLDITPEYIT